MNHLRPTERNILVGIDVQNDFITGSLAVNDGEQVIAPLNAVADVVRQQQGDVIFTRDWHPVDTPHFAAWPVHCVAETDGARFHSNLRVTTGDIIINKGTGQTDGYSAWEGQTDDGRTLETLLQPTETQKKVRVFLGGLATDYCVKATACDIAQYFANDERVATYLLRDAVRAVNLRPDDEAVALAAMKESGVRILTSGEAITMITGGQS
ncbi:MAG: isochorismatase family protein [Candidatus Saccharibacteria bacterium]|nr:isochorismatase family protein [Candidatus Saccharibacteria bacterium]